MFVFDRYHTEETILRSLFNCSEKIIPYTPSVISAKPVQYTRVNPANNGSHNKIQEKMIPNMPMNSVIPQSFTPKLFNSMEKLMAVIE